MNSSTIEPLLNRERDALLSSETTLIINSAAHPVWQWFGGKPNIGKNEESGLAEVSTWK